MPTVNSSVPGLMFLDEAVFTLAEMEYSEGQARRFKPTAEHVLFKHSV
jgi:hypothetical protein